ncbi:MAG: glycyl-radical enzyme activating protein [Candidatus Omnitrophica bacterium]|nr:glycyl-radical enzyme activating protein [Candidatus Omnitrophota bacterium]
MKALIFNIQRFCIHDGPGIRTTIFFKGCNLNCWWCHNPESKKSKPELMFYPDKCILCLSCVKNCPESALTFAEREKKILYDKKKCRECFKCACVCPSEAIVKCGVYMELAEVYEKIIRDKDFYKSVGGVTASGGEPLLYSEFIRELFRKVKEEKIHTCIETAGCINWNSFENVIEFTDLFLYDFKSGDEKKLKEATGGDLNLILENLNNLKKSEKETIVRIPLVPDYNDNEEELEKIVDKLNSFKQLSIEFLKFNYLGKSKYKALGLPSPFKIFEDNILEEKVKFATNFLKNKGFKIIEGDKQNGET